MSKKSSLVAVAMIEKQNAYVKWVHEILALKNGPYANNLNDYLQSKSLAWFVASVEARNNMLEELLFQQGCYKGFCYVNAEGLCCAISGIDAESQACPDWSRRYYHN